MFDKKACIEALLDIKEKEHLLFKDMALALHMEQNTLRRLLVDDHEWMPKTRKKVLQFIAQYKKDFNGFC